jgi:pilus assembly protein CpaE
LHRGGVETRDTDVVSLDKAAELSGLARHELAVLSLPDVEPHRGVELVREIRSASSAQLVVIGPADDPKLILQFLTQGVATFVDEVNLEDQLAAALVRLKAGRRESAMEGGRIIGVLSSSGGCGVSTISANLAAVFSRILRRCALLDLQRRCGDQALLFDLQPRHDVAALCRNAKRLDRSMFVHSLARHSSGVYVLAAPDHQSERFITPQGIRQVMNVARSLFPLVVADLDSSFDSVSLSGVVQSDIILIVLRLDILSLRHTQETLRKLDEIGVAGDQIRVIANRCRQSGQLPPRQVEQALGRGIDHLIVNDPRSSNLALNKGVPVCVERPRSRFSKAIAQIARTLLKTPCLQPDAEFISSSDDLLEESSAAEKSNGTSLKQATSRKAFTGTPIVRMIGN